MSNLQVRIATGLTFIAVMMIGIIFSIKSLFLLFLVINFLCIWEYLVLVDRYPDPENKSPKSEKITTSLMSTLIYVIAAGCALQLLSINKVAWVIPIFFALFIRELFSKTPIPFVRLCLHITGIVYITLPLAMVTVIANYDGTFAPTRILGILFLVSVSDTGAYFAGRRFGKHKLFERISPKKTWEGVYGGFAAAFFVAFLLGIFFKSFSPSTWFAIAFITTVFGILGDLIESLLKRSLGVKDSGNILPGHGGILDRFDAFIFAIPFVFSYLYLY